MENDQAMKAYDEHKEEQILSLQRQYLSSGKWAVREKVVHQLAPFIQEHPAEFQEALLLAGPAAFINNMLSTIVSERTQLCNKLLAADMLSDICSNCIKACLLLSPSRIVETLMRCAYQGQGDTKAAAARALWRLSCHNDFSPEVIVMQLPCSLRHTGSCIDVALLEVIAPTRQHWLDGL